MGLKTSDAMEKPMRGNVESYADDLREAFAGLGGSSPEPEEPEPHPLQPRTSPKAEREPDPELDTSEPDGTQESKYGDPETPLSVIPEIEERAAAEKAAAQQVQAPDFWPDEDRQKFNALPDDATRQTVLDYQKSIEKSARDKFNAADRARKFEQEVGQIMAPFDAELQGAGMTRLDGIKRLVNAERLLRQNPQEGLNWLLSQYGGGQFEVVRKGAQPAQAQTAAPAAQQPSGNGHISEATVAQLVDQRFQSIIAAQQRQQQQAQVEEAQTRIQEFAVATGEDGAPKYPHFEEVKVHMGALMQSGAAQSLEDAYEQAIWTLPALREGLVKARQEAAAKAASEAQKQAVAKAKAARTPHTASRGQPTAEEDDDLSQQEVLRKVWRQQQSGVARV